MAQVRHVLRLTAVIFATLVAAAPAAPRGAPSELRVARPTDHRAHPGALSEWWTLRAVNLRGRGTLELRVLREPGSTGVRLLGADVGGSFMEGLGFTGIRAGARRLEGDGPMARLVVQANRGGLDIDVAGPTIAGRLRLRGARRGPAALGWRLGSVVRVGDTRGSPVSLAWTVPVATSSVSGTLRLGGARQIELRRWRASYEHGWGALLFRDEQWDAWDQYVVHGRRASEAWLIHGLNRADTVTGPGARDAQWLGVLARVDRSGVHVCPPRVHRRRWSTTAQFESYPGRLRAACGGRRLAVKDRSTSFFLDYTSHFEAHAIATAPRGARGMTVHLGHRYGP
jgi:hypothetical protein